MAATTPAGPGRRQRSMADSNLSAMPPALREQKMSCTSQKLPVARNKYLIYTIITSVIVSFIAQFTIKSTNIKNITYITIITINVVGVIIFPFIEEIVFRKYLYSLCNLIFSKKNSISIIFVVWVLIHYFDGITKMLLVVPFGIIVSAARYNDENIKYCVFLHMVYNIISINTSLLT